MQNCTVCNVNINSFSMYKDKCHSCYKKSQREFATAFYREKNTGCSLELYNELYEKQKGCCAICGKHSTELKRALSADHCHKYKFVRGLLCGKCNTGLGMFNDDIELFFKAIKYIIGNNNG